jgi:hypothetical protein
MAAKSKKPILFIGGGIALVALIGYAYFASAGWTYSEGSRAGVVVKFSKKGTFMKTWEGELSMGAVDQGGVREKWQFSVEEPMVEKVQDAMDHGHRVKLLYRQQYRSQSWKGQTEYFIVGVERVGN